MMKDNDKGFFMMIEGGKIDWERAGYSADSVYAEIGEYVIAVKSPTYKIENVIF